MKCIYLELARKEPNMVVSFTSVVLNLDSIEEVKNYKAIFNNTSIYSLIFASLNLRSRL